MYDTTNTEVCVHGRVQDKKEHVKTCGLLGTAQVNSVGCVLGQDSALLQQMRSYVVTNEDMILSVHLGSLTASDTLGFPIRVQAHQISLYEPFALVDALQPSTDWLCQQRGVFDGSKNIDFAGIHTNKRLMGILFFPSVKVPSCWLLGKILCIEHSGGSSALVYTVNSCSSCDHKIMVSDNRSWLWFKVKNNSLLTFFPLWVCGAKSLWFGKAAKALWEQEV